MQLRMNWLIGLILINLISNISCQKTPEPYYSKGYFCLESMLKIYDVKYLGFTGFSNLYDWCEKNNENF